MTGFFRRAPGPCAPSADRQAGAPDPRGRFPVATLRPYPSATGTPPSADGCSCSSSELLPKEASVHEIEATPPRGVTHACQPGRKGSGPRPRRPRRVCSRFPRRAVAGDPREDAPVPLPAFGSSPPEDGGNGAPVLLPGDRWPRDRAPERGPEGDPSPRRPNRRSPLEEGPDRPSGSTAPATGDPRRGSVYCVSPSVRLPVRFPARVAAAPGADESVPSSRGSASSQRAIVGREYSPRSDSRSLSSETR